MHSQLNAAVQARTPPPHKLIRRGDYVCIILRSLTLTSSMFLADIIQCPLDHWLRLNTALELLYLQAHTPPSHKLP